MHTPTYRSGVAAVSTALMLASLPSCAPQTLHTINEAYRDSSKNFLVMSPDGEMHPIPKGVRPLVIIDTDGKRFVPGDTSSETAWLKPVKTFDSFDAFGITYVPEGAFCGMNVLPAR